MATSPEDKALLISLNTQFQAFLNGTIAPSAMTGAQRKTIEDALFPIINGLRVKKGDGNNDYGAYQVGDLVDHIDETNKTHYAGKVLSSTFSGLADINDSTKFDRYEKDKVSL